MVCGLHFWLNDRLLSRSFSLSHCLVIRRPAGVSATRERPWV